MDFDEDRAIPFEGGQDDGAVGVGTFGKEGGGRVGDFFKSGLGHFENSNFVGGAKAVFDGTDGFESAVTVAFEV